MAFELLLVCCLTVVVMHANFRYYPGSVSDCRSTAAATAAACSTQECWSSAGATWSAFACFVDGVEVITRVFP